MPAHRRCTVARLATTAMIAHPPEMSCSPPPIDPIRKAAEHQVDQRMGHRQHVLERQSAGAARYFTFHSPDRHFLISESLIQHQANDVCLKSESARVWMPAHDIMAQMDGKTVVVVQIVIADRVDEKRKGVR